MALLEKHNHFHFHFDLGAAFQSLHSKIDQQSAMIEANNKLINSKLDNIMGTQKDAAAQLNTVADQLAKVRSEVEALKEAAQNATNVDPELQAAIDRVATAVQGVDDLNPDAPAEEEPQS